MPIGNPTMVQGARARGALSANREDTDFAKGIALLDPFESPITSLTMSFAAETSKTVDKHWLEDELCPETDTVNYGSGYDSSSTAIIVDNGARFAVGDRVMHNTTREVMLVTAISSNTLTVDRDYGQAGEGWTALAGNITDGDYLTIIDNAFEQGHPLPAMRSTVEVEYKNYCQDVRTPTGWTEVNKATAMRGMEDYALQERKKGIEHQQKLERMNLWGKPVEGDKGMYVAGTGNVNPTAAGGINHYIQEYAPSNQKFDETELTMQEFIDKLEYVFEHGTGTKWCYCPPRLRTALDTWGISKYNTFSKEKVFGVPVARWLSSHGEVIFMTHKMLKNPQADDWLYCFFIDQDLIKWNTLRRIGTTRLRRMDPYKATGETSEKMEFQTIGCIRYGQPWVHSRLRFKTIG
ncbi:MAG TPA: DUF5309 family protein [Armatimonadota bacterium]|nr:DUF5309 family protein [Armatimonadota bacterium]